MYVYTVLNMSDRDLMFLPSHMSLLSMSAMTLRLTYFEIRIMPEKQFDKKRLRCMFSSILNKAHCRSVIA